MFRPNCLLALVVIVVPLVGLSATACIGDPNTQFTLQVTNKADHPVRVAVSRMWSMVEAPPHEETGVDVILGSGETRQAGMVLATGDYPGPVRAYSDGHLVFCQRYVYEAKPASGVTWRVEIVEGRVACQ